MSHAEICPVCGGTGRINPTSPYTTTIIQQVTCHGCQGIGWVTVPDPVDFNTK